MFPQIKTLKSHWRQPSNTMGVWCLIHSPILTFDEPRKMRVWCSIYSHILTLANLYIPLNARGGQVTLPLLMRCPREARSYQ